MKEDEHRIRSAITLGRLINDCAAANLRTWLNIAYHLRVQIVNKNMPFILEMQLISFKNSPFAI